MHIGCDLVHIPTFAAQLAQPGTTMLEWFTPGEQEATGWGRNPQAAQHLAARWAAKEAFLKAWSSQHLHRPPLFDETQMRWADIEVITDAWGRPQLQLHGWVQKASGYEQAAVSLSHDGDYAFASCVLE